MGRAAARGPWRIDGTFRGDPAKAALRSYRDLMLGRRTAWLGRPWFFVAVVVLALNDHVLKAAWPGWVTGKLSDLAGVLVVATLLAVLTGPTRGVLLAAAGFAALKTIPGVAEAASPVLGGGLVLRDPTDLIALGVLPPLWWRLRHERPVRGNRVRRGWQAVGLVAAVLATTATSQAPPHYVTLGSGTGMVHARVDPGSGFEQVFLASQDGGRTWARTPVPSVAVDWEVERPSPGIRAQACAADGTCFRIRSGPNGEQVVERSVAGSPWQHDGELPYNTDPDLAIDASASDHVVALGAERTVFSRQAAEDWVEVDLAPLAAPPQWQQSLVATMGSQSGAVTTFVLALILVLLLVPWTAVKVAMVVATVQVTGLAFLFAPVFVPTAVATLTAGCLVAVVALGILIRLTWWIDRRPRKASAVATDGPGAGGSRATWPGRRRLPVAMAVAVAAVAVLALAIMGSPLAGGSGSVRTVLAWLGSPVVTLTLAAALSVLGWLLLPTLSAKWVAQVCILWLGGIAYAGGSGWSLLLLGVAPVWLNLAWAGLVVAGIVLARGASARGRATARMGTTRGSGFDPPSGAR